MKEKLRIELASENRLGRDTFYAELYLPATAEQIKDAKQRARFMDDGDMTYQSVSILYFLPLPNLEHIRLDSAAVEELNYLAQRLDLGRRHDQDGHRRRADLYGQLCR